jgi:hypothetical protein
MHSIPSIYVTILGLKRVVRNPDGTFGRNSVVLCRALAGDAGADSLPVLATTVPK